MFGLECLSHGSFNPWTVDSMQRVSANPTGYEYCCRRVSACANTSLESYENTVNFAKDAALLL